CHRLSDWLRAGDYGGGLDRALDRGGTRPVAGLSGGRGRMTKATLNLSPPLSELQGEAERMGVSFPALLTAELVSYRSMAQAAHRQLGEWEWSLLSHVMSGIEAHRILAGDDTLPSAGSIVAAIDEWADGAQDDEALRAGKLRGQAIGWSPLAIAGVMMRLRR